MSEGPTNPTTGENLLSSADAAAQAFIGFQEKIQLIVDTVNPQAQLDGMRASIVDLQDDLRHLKYELGLYKSNIKPLDSDIDRPPQSGNLE